MLDVRFERRVELEAPVAGDSWAAWLFFLLRLDLRLDEAEVILVESCILAGGGGSEPAGLDIEAVFFPFRLRIAGTGVGTAGGCGACSETFCRLDRRADTAGSLGGGWVGELFSPDVGFLFREDVGLDED